MIIVIFSYNRTRRSLIHDIDKPVDASPSTYLIPFSCYWIRDYLYSTDCKLRHLERCQTGYKYEYFANIISDNYALSAQELGPASRSPISI